VLIPAHWFLRLYLCSIMSTARTMYVGPRCRQWPKRRRVGGEEIEEIEIRLGGVFHSASDHRHGVG